MFSLETWVSNINVHKTIRHNIPSITKPKRHYDCNRLRQICTNFIVEEYVDFHKIYTDGSKSSAGNGAAVWDPQFNTNVKLAIDSDISIMHVELIAIAEALSYINSISHDKFVILTDSKSSLQHLARCTSSVRGVPIAYTILESIFKLEQKLITVVLQWIPSHVQIQDNEKVDLLANQAVSDGISVNVPPLYTDYLSSIKQQCTDIWSEYFNQRSTEKGIWYKTIQPQLPVYNWTDQNMLSRRDLVMALRLRSGHIPSKKFGFLMKKVPSITKL